VQIYRRQYFSYFLPVQIYRRQLICLPSAHLLQLQQEACRLDDNILAWAWLLLCWYLQIGLFTTVGTVSTLHCIQLDPMTAFLKQICSLHVQAIAEDDAGTSAPQEYWDLKTFSWFEFGQSNVQAV
jgi:hypothetical protein